MAVSLSVIYIVVLLLLRLTNRVPKIITIRDSDQAVAAKFTQDMNFGILFAIGYPLFLYALST
jgi:hypothetical protein